MNVYYTLSSVFCFILQVVSLKGEKYMKLILLNSFIYVFRLSIRFYDFENSHDPMGSAKWAFLLGNNLTGLLFCQVLKMSAVKKDKFQSLIFLIECSLIFIAFIKGCNLIAKKDGEDQLFLDDLKNFIFCIIFLTYSFYLQNKVNIQLFDEMFSRVQNQS